MNAWGGTLLAFSALPEVGALFASADPAWVWSRDGSRLLWANPAGGAYLGASRFAVLSGRRWPPNHALRRAIDSLARSLPPGGSLARLRVKEALTALPLACRCSYLRAGSERGVLVVASSAKGRAPTLAELAAFYSGAGRSAVLLDAAGAVVAAGGGLATEIDQNQPHVLVVAADRRLRLYLTGATSDPAIADAAEARATELQTSDPPPTQSPPFADTAPPPPAAGEAPDATANNDVALVGGTPMSAPAKDLASPLEPAKIGAPPSLAASALPPPQMKSAAEEAAGTGAPVSDHDHADRAAPSVKAGRVAAELARAPVRFLWQTDAAGRVLFVSAGLAQVVGRNAEIIGERWEDAATRLRLDPSGRITRSLNHRDTWSGQTAWWPVEGSQVRVPAELTALPIFDADRNFQGYRGFGVLRPAEALMPATFEARFGPPDDAAVTLAEQLPPYEEAVDSAPVNVVPIRADLEPMGDQPRGLSSQERTAFEEIAATLRSRIVEAAGPDETDPQADQAAPVAKEPEPDGTLEAPPLSSADSDAGGAAATQSAETTSASSEAPAAVSDAPSVTEPEPPALKAVESTSAEPRTEPPAEPPTESPAEPAAEPPTKPQVPEPIAAGPQRGQSPTSAPPDREATAADKPPAESGSAASASVADMQRRIAEMTAILDTATDGVVIVDAGADIESVNASAEALFGLDGEEMKGQNFIDLLTPDCRQAALDYLSGLKDSGVASLLNEGREVEARAGSGSIPLFMTMGRISGGTNARFCAVLRDITHWKRIEAELVAAKRAAEEASSQKSEFLARVSHEIRTPLNAIIGFAEVMIEERFGPVENERYREYLRDIRTSGEHVVSLVNDLLDISKIEAGKLDLNFAAVPLNDLLRECIGLMQPQANRAHVVLRSSLSRDVPAIVADERTLRQIILNLLSNSVKYTGPGGQVIASTSLAESGEAFLRVRDTGEGMSREELARALEPFRQLTTATIADRSGTGLGLPLTKALVEANRATLSIRSARGEGTVVTVTIPPTRVLSE